jgi:hypothetical protein
MIFEAIKRDIPNTTKFTTNCKKVINPVLLNKSSTVAIQK